MNPDEKLDLQAQVLMLTHVTASLWANFLANSGHDPVRTTQRIAEESLNNLDELYERLGTSDPSPGLHPTIQAVLHHEEGFWKQVEEQVRGHRNVSGR